MLNVIYLNLLHCRIGAFVRAVKEELRWMDGASPMKYSFSEASQQKGAGPCWNRWRRARSKTDFIPWSLHRCTGYSRIFLGNYGNAADEHTDDCHVIKEGQQVPSLTLWAKVKRRRKYPNLMAMDKCLSGCGRNIGPMSAPIEVFQRYGALASFAEAMRSIRSFVGRGKASYWSMCGRNCKLMKEREWDRFTWWNGCLRPYAGRQVLVFYYSVIRLFSWFTDLPGPVRRRFLTLQLMALYGHTSGNERTGSLRWQKNQAISKRWAGLLAAFPSFLRGTKILSHWTQSRTGSCCENHNCRRELKAKTAFYETDKDGTDFQA